MEEIKRIEVGPPPASSSYYDDRSTQGINPTAASEQNFNRDGLSAVRGPRVSAPRRIFVFFGNTMAVSSIFALVFPFSWPNLKFLVVAGNIVKMVDICCFFWVDKTGYLTWHFLYCTSLLNILEID